MTPAQDPLDTSFDDAAAFVESLRAPTSFQRACAILVGVFVVLYCLATTITKGYGTPFFAIPLFVGFIAGIVKPRRPYLASLVALGIALGLAIITLFEGVVCVLFSLPVLVPMLWLGAWVGSVLVRHLHTRRARGNAMGLSLLLAVGWQVSERSMDEPARHPVHVASDSIVVNAAPHQVWTTLTSGNLRVEPRFPWFVRVGLPMPQRLSVDQGGLGGRVRCELSVGVAFASITQWQPDRSFAFDVLRYDIQDQPFHITRLGRGPDYGFRRERIEDWLTLLDTSYSLEPAGAGRTLLRRRVVWRRHLAPGVYFGWLQQTVMEHSQRRLLELIRSRAEALDESSVLLARRAGP